MSSPVFPLGDQADLFAFDRIQQSANSELELEEAKKHYKERKEREAKEEQARLIRRQNKQRRGAFLSRFTSIITCGLVGSSTQADKKHPRSTPKLNLIPPTPVKRPPPPSAAAPAPTTPTKRPKSESKRMSGISRVEEWKERSQTDLLQPPSPKQGEGSARLTSKSAPELVGKPGGTKLNWLEY